MDTGSLVQQVNDIIERLRAEFDAIGVPSHERDKREAELFEALSETLQNQARLVASEKKDLIDEAQKIITAIRQMEASLGDSKESSNEKTAEKELKITYPLTRCLQALKEKHGQMARLHRERFEQVKKLVQALESYSSHLEPSFVLIELPPTGPKQSVPPSFDLSSSYVDKLDQEFTRVYEEYSRRVAAVQSLADNIIQLWAELGTAQAQQDGAIVKYYRESPEQLGLHEEDMHRLRAKKEKLEAEKRSREKHLKDLRVAVEVLWEKLGVEEHECKAFLNSNRGCGMRQINEFEDELARLNELKRQNLHLFVEDARCKLQELWDALYFSEDEMLDFTPAFSDVFSDALLEAHEREVSRLEVLREQRAPTLALVEKHRSLVQERDELAASSQDASRLMMRGQKGERRDPGKLLREEKMRKRIAKDLPKVTTELRKELEQWEDEYGRPFLVRGERYLDMMEMEEPKAVPGPRSKTPAVDRSGPPSAWKNGNVKLGTIERANSVGSLRSTTKSAVKTPTASHSILATHSRSQSVIQMNTPKSHVPGSPTRITARAPLSNLKNGNNSTERPRRPESRVEMRTDEAGRPPKFNRSIRAPPPKMRELLPPGELDTPVGHHAGYLGSTIVRHVEPEDVYDDRPVSRQQSARPISLDFHPSASLRQKPPQYEASAIAQQVSYPVGPAVRHVSTTSTTESGLSGSENWETYDDNSEPELDASDAYFAKVRAARQGNLKVAPAKGRGLRPAVSRHDEAQIMSGSEWTDEEPY